MEEQAKGRTHSLSLKIFAHLLIGIGDTIERRRGARIKARGIYRDPARSSKSHFVKTSGLRPLVSHGAGAYAVGGSDLRIAVADNARSV